jgi:hypothetical protein
MAIRRSVVLVAVLVAAASLVAPPSAGSATCESWSPQPPEPPGATETHLSSVTATSPCNAWAVGTYVTAHSPGKTLAIRWNGARWVREQSLQVPSSKSILFDVDAWSAQNAWAVGDYQTGGDTYPLILRRRPQDRSWQNATFQGQTQPGAFSGVSASSATNAWAVGESFGGAARNLIVHWKGGHWVKEAAPHVGGHANYLTDVAAVSSSAAWAVGEAWDGSSNPKLMILHWNGSSWRAQSPPALPAGAIAARVRDVTAISATNAWAVGAYVTATDSIPFVMHRTGGKWKFQELPDVGDSADLAGVAAGSASSVWAVGFTDTDTIIFHWNGRKWILEPGLSIDDDVTPLAVAAEGPSGAWAVGDRDDGTKIHPFALHCC